MQTCMNNLDSNTVNAKFLTLVKHDNIFTFNVSWVVLNVVFSLVDLIKNCFLYLFGAHSNSHIEHRKYTDAFKG